MLPHIKYNSNLEAWIKRLSSLIPFIFMGAYWMNVQDPNCAVNFSDPKGIYSQTWGNYSNTTNTSSIVRNASYFKNGSLNVPANITYIINTTVTYYPYPNFV